MGKFKVGVGLWCVSFAADRFLSTGYRPPQSLEQQIRIVSRISGAESIDMHTSDFEDVNPKDVAKMVRDYNLKVNAVNANIFGNPIYMFGAFTNTDEKIRRKAIDESKKSLDLARELGAQISSLWPGQDGSDYYFQNDYYHFWDSTVSALKELCDYAPDMKICYEYKPKEPRMVCFIGHAGTALALIKEVGAKNLGATLDYGHAVFAGENPSQSLCLFNRAGKLFNVHFNDTYGNWDDDLIVGSVNIWSNLEFFWYLKQTGYDGYITLDMFPYREDPFEACSLAVRMIQTFEKIVDTMDGTLVKKYQKENNAPAILEMLRRKVLMHE